MEIIKKAAYIFVAACIVLAFLLVQYFSASILSFPCIFHKITGLYCAGCGGTRALISLFHGDIIKAIHLNSLLMVLLPVALYCYLVGFFKTFFKVQLPFIKNYFPWLWVLLILTFVFMIVRNIDLFPFTFLKPT